VSSVVRASRNIAARLHECSPHSATNFRSVRGERLWPIASTLNAMTRTMTQDSSLPVAAWHRATDRRDPRFDGIFLVGITSTHIYCRPVCPSRTARPENRRFFISAADAERSGFRACLRCRPDLAPGRSPIDALPRLARAASKRIAEGALNGSSITALAQQLGVSPRHLRRAVEREYGVPPRALAEACRLKSAQHLLVETNMPVIQVAYASGFQSVRRFNAAFRACYRAAPTALRKARAT
jgi:AraC family transcriptional regulator of adaptative response / DNA-3-methyladenine glycosylase II